MNKIIIKKTLWLTIFCLLLADIIVGYNTTLYLILIALFMKVHFSTWKYKQIISVFIVFLGFTSLVILSENYSGTYTFFNFSIRLFFSISLVIALLFILYQYHLLKLEIIKNISILLVSFGIGLLIVEGIVNVNVNNHFDGLLSSIEENSNSNYSSPFQSNFNNIYNIPEPNEQISFETEEFAYTRTANSYGVFAIEFDELLNNSDESYVVLCLGDSFTDGFGTDHDSTWVKVMERELNTCYKNVIAINAGTIGSDPYFNYLFLRDHLNIIQPNRVIFAINDADITDTYQRGGLNRVKNGSVIEFDKAPYWEPFYASSLLFRLIIHSFTDLDQIFVPISEYDKINRNVTFQFIELFSKVDSLLKPSNIDWDVVVLPFRQECKAMKYLNKYWNEIDKVYPNEVMFLLDYWKHDKKIDCNEIYWSLDSHFNSKGYQLFGETVAKNICNQIE